MFASSLVRISAIRALKGKKMQRYILRINDQSEVNYPFFHVLKLSPENIF